MQLSFSILIQLPCPGATRRCIAPTPVREGVNSHLSGGVSMTCPHPAPFSPPFTSAGTRHDTIARKNDTCISRFVQNDSILPENRINPARKKPHMALIQRPIYSRNELDIITGKKRRKSAFKRRPYPRSAGGKMSTEPQVRPGLSSAFQ